MAFLNQEFNSKENTKIRKWFFSTFSNQLLPIEEKYWLEDHFLKIKIKKEEIDVLDNVYKWEPDNNKIIEFTYPPLRKIKIRFQQNEVTFAFQSTC